MSRERGAGDARRPARQRRYAALLITLSLALLASLVDVSGVAAAPVQDLSAPGQPASGYQVAIDGKGNALIVWQRRDGAGHWRIQLRRRSASGRLGPTKTLSAAGQDATSPQVAVDANGNAIVVWEREDGAGHWRIQLRRRSASGDLGPTRTLSAAGQDASSAQVAVDGNGSAFVVWNRVDGAHYRIQLRRRSASGSLGPVQTLSAAGQDADTAQIAIDRKGNAIVVWQRQDGGGVWRIQLRRRSASGSLSAIRTLSAAGQPAASAQVGLDPKGTAMVVWAQSDGSHSRVHLRRRSASGSLGPIQLVSTAGESARWPQVAVDGKGNAFVVWERSDGSHSRIQLRRRSASGTLGPIRTLSAAGQSADHPQVAVDGKGNATVVWDRYDGANWRIQLRRRSASGGFSASRTLSAAGQSADFPQVAVDRNGKAFVVWERWDGSHWQIQGRQVPAG